MFDVYVLEREALLVGRPKGLLNASAAARIVEFIEIKEAESKAAFNRFCDLTRLDSVQLSCADVSELADRRRTFNPNDIPVKSAFLATHPLALGIARMYEQLLNSPRIEVRVFTDLEAVALWLGTRPERLRL